VTGTLIDAAFVVSVVLIWFMLVYQFVLSLLGFVYSHLTGGNGAAWRRMS